MIRSVNLLDIEAIKNLLNYYVKNTNVNSDENPYTSEKIKLKIEDVLKKHEWFIFLDDDSNELLGYAYATTFRPKKAYDKTVETSVYVKNDCVGRGIGFALYQCLFSALKRRGFKTAIAVVEANNIPSIKFHTKYGFKEVGTVENVGEKFGVEYSLTSMQIML